GAYQPGMSDYNVFVRGRSKVFLGGPPLVKMATGEDSDDEELGGGEMHATTSGLAGYLAADEAGAARTGPGATAHMHSREGRAGGGGGGGARGGPPRSRATPRGGPWA